MFAGFASPLPGEKNEDGENRDRINPYAWGEDALADAPEFAGDATEEETGEIPETEQVLEGNLNERLDMAEMPDTIDGWINLFTDIYIAAGHSEDEAAKMAIDTIKTVFTDDIVPENLSQSISIENKQQLIGLYVPLMNHSVGEAAKLERSNTERELSRHNILSDLVNDVTSAELPPADLSAQETTSTETSTTISRFNSPKPDASGKSFAERIAENPSNTSETADFSTEQAPDNAIDMAKQGVDEGENNIFAAAARADNTTNNINGGGETAKVDAIAAKAVYEVGEEAALSEVDEMRAVAAKSERKTQGDGGVEQERDPSDPNDGSAPDQTDVIKFSSNTLGEAAAIKAEGEKNAKEGDLDAIAVTIEKAEEAGARAKTALGDSAEAGVNTESAAQALKADEETIKNLTEISTLLQESAAEEAESNDAEDGDTKQIIGIFGDGKAPVGNMDEIKQELNEKRENKKKEDEEKGEDKKPAFDFGAYADPLANE